MPTRKAEATWNGDLKAGKGTIKLGSGAFEGQYAFGTRFEDGVGTNPEELIGAALAGCYSMALSANLGRAGFEPRRVHTTAGVRLEKVGEGFSITRIDLDTEGDVPGIDEKAFAEQAEATRKGCIVARTLTGTEIRVNAKLATAAH